MGIRKLKPATPGQKMCIRDRAHSIRLVSTVVASVALSMELSVLRRSKLVA